jgi:hypothetical protein
MTAFTLYFYGKFQVTAFGEMHGTNESALFVSGLTTFSPTRGHF